MTFRNRNPVNRFDVNGDGYLTPLDALMLINYTNQGNDPTIPEGSLGLPFLDVSDSGTIIPNDVLQVINELNRMAAESSPGGEGEAEGAVVNSQLSVVS